jgi:predicted transcriptional regulator
MPDKIAMISSFEMRVESANGGAANTKMMYSAFCSFEQLKEWIAFLLEKELIEHEEATKKFRTTEKGIRMLRVQNRINDEFLPTLTEDRRRIPIDY